MNVYRIGISTNSNLTDLSGSGAKIVGGRWNPPGTPLLYTYETVALAILSSLVHFPSNVETQKLDVNVISIQLPDGSINTLDSNTASPENLLNKTFRYTVVDKWISQGQYLALRVPSEIIKTEFYVLINPLHPQASELKIVNNYKISLNDRIVV